MRMNCSIFDVAFRRVLLIVVSGILGLFLRKWWDAQQRLADAELEIQRLEFQLDHQAN